MFSQRKKSLYSEEKTFFRGNMFSTAEKSHTLGRKLFSAEICVFFCGKSLYSEEKSFFRGNMFSTAEKSLYSKENTFFRGNMFSTREKSHVIASLGINAFSCMVFLASGSIQRRAAPQQRPLYWQAYMTYFRGKKFSPQSKDFFPQWKTYFRGENIYSVVKSKKN